METFPKQNCNFNGSLRYFDVLELKVKENTGESHTKLIRANSIILPLMFKHRRFSLLLHDGFNKLVTFNWTTHCPSILQNSGLRYGGWMLGVFHLLPQMLLYQIANSPLEGYKYTALLSTDDSNLYTYVLMSFCVKIPSVACQYDFDNLFFDAAGPSVIKRCRSVVASITRVQVTKWRCDKHTDVNGTVSHSNSFSPVAHRHLPGILHTYNIICHKIANIVNAFLSVLATCVMCTCTISTKVFKASFGRYDNDQLYIISCEICMLNTLYTDNSCQNIITNR